MFISFVFCLWKGVWILFPIEPHNDNVLPYANTGIVRASCLYCVFRVVSLVLAAHTHIVIPNEIHLEIQLFTNLQSVYQSLPRFEIRIQKDTTPHHL